MQFGGRGLLLPVLCGLIVLAGCQDGAAGSPSVSAEASDSATVPSPSVTEPLVSVPPFPTVVLPPDSLVRVLVDLGLSDSPPDPIRGTATAGSSLTVVGGPRDYEGGTWYEVLDADGLFAWVRLDDPASVELVAGRCPDDYQDAMTMLAWDRLVCFDGAPVGGAGVTVTGQLSHCQGGVVEAEPEWLAYTCWGVSDLRGGSMGVHVGPDSGIALPVDVPAEEGVRARATGHFDDPAAESCLFHSASYVDSPWLAPSPDEQILLCREAFVLDELAILE